MAEFANLSELRNIFTRFLDGEPLSELNWVGLVEDYQASIDLFYAMYATGCNPREIKPHENKNAAHPEGYELENDTRAKIEALNWDDMELYRRAQEMFQGLVKRYGDGY